MSDHIELIADSAARLFADIGPLAWESTLAPPSSALWERVTDAGYPNLFQTGEQGGYGGWREAFPILEAVGRYALALPVPEAMLAVKLLVDAGCDVPAGRLTVAPRTEGALSNTGNGPTDGAGTGTSTSTDTGTGAQRFTGTLSEVPWGQHSGAIVAMVSGVTPWLICMQRSDALRVETFSNSAGEPRDRLVYENATPLVCRKRTDPLELYRLGALMRAAQMAGACRTSLRLSLDHVNQRVQFGRAIGKFQAVQQQLALFAEQAAAVERVVRDACQAEDFHAGGVAAGIAKLRANLAIDTATAVAHQVHGAIGFTQEYSLHHFTRRLIAWRAEFGNDRFWSSYIGDIAASAGAEGFWPWITSCARDTFDGSQGPQ